MTSATPLRRAAALALMLAAACTAVHAKKPHPDAVPKAEGKSCPDGWAHKTTNKPAGQTGLDHWCVPKK